MFTDLSARPARWSIRDGIPKPSACTSGSARCSSSTIESSSSSSASCEECSLGRSTRAPSEPSRETTAARIFVPPTSTPMTRDCSKTRGYHTPPDVDTRRREALPRLPGRTHEGPGADGRPAREVAPSPEGRARRAQPLPGSRAEDDGRPPAADSLGPRADDRARPDRRLLPRLGRARLPRLPRRRLGGEQAAAAERAPRADARPGQPALDAVRDPAARHRPLDRRGPGGRPALGLDHAAAHRPAAPPALLPLDPARPARRDPRLRRREDQHRLPGRRPAPRRAHGRRPTPTSRSTTSSSSTSPSSKT